jgi:hypothetical protein
MHRHPVTKYQLPARSCAAVPQGRHRTHLYAWARGLFKDLGVPSLRGWHANTTPVYKRSPPLLTPNQFLQLLLLHPKTAHPKVNRHELSSGVGGSKEEVVRLDVTVPSKKVGLRGQAKDLSGVKGVENSSFSWPVQTVHPRGFPSSLPHMIPRQCIWRMTSAIACR